MNASLRRRLFGWLSGSILVAGLLAAALSFLLSYQEANDLQDTQLRQVAAVVAKGTLLQAPPKFEPRDDEDAETHFVIKQLGSTRLDPDPALDLVPRETLLPGLQSIDYSGVRW